MLDAAAEGLDAVVVHPSGILGPGDEGGGNHLVQMVRDYLAGRLPACVAGGYDLVDVRDVAQGCLLALEKGKKGECYILSNQFCSVKKCVRACAARGGWQAPGRDAHVAGPRAAPFCGGGPAPTPAAAVYRLFAVYAAQQRAVLP